MLISINTFESRQTCLDNNAVISIAPLTISRFSSLDLLSFFRLEGMTWFEDRRVKEKVVDVSKQLTKSRIFFIHTPT